MHCPKVFRTHRPDVRPLGFSLPEILVLIALLGASVAVFGVAAGAVRLRNSSWHTTQAVALAEGATVAAQFLPTAALTNRTNAPAIGFVEHRGQWAVQTNNSAPSLSRVFTVTSSSPALLGTTAAARFPSSPFSNGTTSISLLTPTIFPSGWKAGILFRARDLGNGYRLRVDATTLVFERLQDGVATTLYSLSRIHNPNTWVQIAVTGSGSSLSIIENSSTLTTVTDSTWSSGESALVLLGNGTVSFDTASVSGDATGAWNFDTDTVGETPAVWRSLGGDSLPNGSISVTVDRPTTGGTLARIATTVQWTESRGVRSVSTTDYQ